MAEVRDPRGLVDRELRKVLALLERLRSDLENDEAVEPAEAGRARELGRAAVVGAKREHDVVPADAFG